MYEPLRFSTLQSTDNENEWEYTMRRSMQEIVPGLFLGPYSCAVHNKLDYLKEHGITHIVCIRHPQNKRLIKPNFPDIFTYLVLDVKDEPNEVIIPLFARVKEFIDASLTNQGKVLVHGNAGMSRSAALVIAYLMETFGLSFHHAWSHVLKMRFCICLNEGFTRQLVEYEPIYLSRYQIRQTLEDSSNDNLSKRMLEDEEPICRKQMRQ